MQKWIRNTHLFIGLISLPFLLMYSLSAAQMAHRKWFKPNPTITNATFSIPGAEAADGRALARTLIARGIVRGEVQRVQAKPNGFEVRLVRPGTVQDITYDRASGQAQVHTSTSDIVFMLNRLHHIAGTHHKDPMTNVWGVALGLVGALLMLLAASGIYLWFKMHGEFVVGIVLLTLSLGFGAGMIYALRVT